MKKLGLAALLLAAALALSACGGPAAAMASRLVKGNLDAVYFGTAEEDYLALVDSSAAEIEAMYEQGMEVEAQAFALYYGVDYLTDELTDELADMYKQIYQSARYEVGTASEMADGSYGVPVRVWPLDIIQLVNERAGAYLDEYNSQFTDEQVAAMTEEEYQAYDTGWARAIIQCCLDSLPDMGYMEERSMVIQVMQDEDGLWNIYRDDFVSLDEAIIYYP